jgi:hypothetical protein
MITTTLDTLGERFAPVNEKAHTQRIAKIRGTEGKIFFDLSPFVDILCRLKAGKTFWEFIQYIHTLFVGESRGASNGKERKIKAN